MVTADGFIYGFDGFSYCAVEAGDEEEKVRMWWRRVNLILIRPNYLCLCSWLCVLLVCDSCLYKMLIECDTVNSDTGSDDLKPDIKVGQTWWEKIDWFVLFIKHQNWGRWEEKSDSGHVGSSCVNFVYFICSKVPRSFSALNSWLI